MKPDWEKVAVVGAIGAAAVYLLGRVKKTADKIVAPIASPIAAVITAVTLPSEITLRGTVELPNGIRFPLNDIRVDSDLSFSYKGIKYRMRGRDGNVYYADFLS